MVFPAIISIVKDLKTFSVLTKCITKIFKHTVTGGYTELKNLSLSILIRIDPINLLAKCFLCKTFH